MNVLKFMVMLGLSCITTSFAMQDGGLVTKEKEIKVIDGSKYSIKFFKQSCTTDSPLQVFISRSKNKKTGLVSFSGGINTLVFNESKMVYESYPGGTTDLDNTDFTSLHWRLLRELFKKQKN